MSYSVKNGQTSVVLRFKLLDSSSVVGAGLTGLTTASTGLIISTILTTEAAAVSYTVGSTTVDPITTLGTFSAPTSAHCRFKQVDSANHPGLYEFQFEDSRFSGTGSQALIVSVSGATNLQQADYVVPLVKDDPFTAKPANYASLVISGGGSVTASSGATVLLSSGTGAGQLDFTSGVVKANTTQLSGQTVTAAAGVTFPTTVASPSNITAGTITTVSGNVNGSVNSVVSAVTASSGVVVLLSSGTATGQIVLASGQVTVATNNDKTGYTASTVSDKTGYSLSQTFPTNFSSLSISTAGAVTTASTASYPTNFTSLLISTDGYVTAGTVNDKTGYALTSGERTSISDAILDRDLSAGTDTTSQRTPRQAIRFLRNKWAVSSGTLTVYKEDDTTSSWTATVGTDASANPIVSNDPA